jgi:CBS domain-containing protein
LVIDDEEDTPLGIITERDLSIKACILDKSSKDIPSNQIMSSPLFTINEDSSLMDAADLMLKNKVRHILVVSNESGHKEKTIMPEKI